MSTPLCLVLTTVATDEDARCLARAMVEQRLAACAQINPIDSVYRWNGALHCELEWRVLFKTTEAARPALQAALRAAHPYELPAIVALPMTAEEDFAQWMETQIGEGSAE
ncbi:MAG: divalent-cation tolerance protein CutA [Burkholderiaceae bacterium]|jgi:periplasmic divalent cation tolerance protein|nr:divalent-cation tolerance protein CutA [Burkholderiaceae bacterium]